MPSSIPPLNDRAPDIVWRPTADYIERSRLRRFMRDAGVDSYEALLVPLAGSFSACLARYQVRDDFSERLLNSRNHFQRRVLAWANADPARFWDATVRDLDLQFYQPYTRTLDLARGLPWARWFAGGLYQLRP